MLVSILEEIAAHQYEDHGPPYAHEFHFTAGCELCTVTFIVFTIHITTGCRLLQTSKLLAMVIKNFTTDGLF